MTGVVALREAGDVVGGVARAFVDGVVMSKVVGGAAQTDALKLDGAFDAVAVAAWASVGAEKHAGAAADGPGMADDELVLAGAVASMEMVLEASTGAFVAQWGYIAAMPTCLLL